MWYTIKSGDSLSLLAQKYLGSLMLFNEIYEENKDVIRDPNLVYAGTKIWIPINGQSKPLFNSTTPVFSTQPVATQTISPYQSTFTPATTQIKMSTAATRSVSQDKMLLYGGIGLAAVAVIMALV